jgi:ketosteroid isomerase-like protein
MLRLTLALTASLIFAAPALAAAADAAPVIAAERAFAARAAEVGIAPSFLEFMTDDAIVFQPDPTSARALYAARPAPKPPKDGGTLLNWWPTFAGIAQSGDLGFTTGPATVNGGKPAVFYFTVWARQPDGGWKWVYDGGVEADGSSAPGPEAAVTVLPPPRPELRPLPPREAMRGVRAAETGLAAIAKSDSATAYRAVLAPNARVQGSKLGPATTPDQLRAELATRSKAIDFATLGGGASQAGDLAWTYGDARWKDGRGHYVRIWQRGRGGWKLVFDQIITVEKA